MLPPRDAELVQIIDATLADATRRAERPGGGSWLACRPGCTPCCHGVFRISALDAERLRTGLLDLAKEEPWRAHAIQARAKHAAGVLAPDFPGSATTGQLSDDEDAWEHFADLPGADMACPVLDPASGRCELYASRPLTCRLFGPPVRNEDGIGVCELCYVGAPQQDILAGEMQLAHRDLEEELGAGMAAAETIIAWAVLP